MKACPPRLHALQLLWNLDQGSAADISGVPDPALKDRVQNLFDLLKLDKTTGVGYPWREQGPVIIPCTRCEARVLHAMPWLCSDLHPSPSPHRFMLQGV